MKDNVIRTKTFDFAIEIVTLYKYLRNVKREYVLSRQVLKSGTSIGANVREALEAQSRKDFIAKMYIALKEAAETQYLIDLLIATDYIKRERSTALLKDIDEIIRILTAIIKTTKRQSHK